jgi:hypothetical protein
MSDSQPIDSIGVVLEHNTDKLMRIAGVVGTGEGRQDGKPVIVVMVDRLTSQLASAIPSTLEGYAVVIREVGKIEAH